MTLMCFKRNIDIANDAKVHHLSAANQYFTNDKISREDLSPSPHQSAQICCNIFLWDLSLLSSLENQFDRKLN